MPGANPPARDVERSRRHLVTGTERQPPAGLILTGRLPALQLGLQHGDTGLGGICPGRLAHLDAAAQDLLGRGTDQQQVRHLEFIRQAPETLALVALPAGAQDPIPPLETLVGDMFQTMYEANGRGLAAPPSRRP